MEYFEYLESKFPSLKQIGLFTVKTIDEYGFDSDEGIDATDMYQQSFETFNALFIVNR